MKNLIKTAWSCWDKTDRLVVTICAAIIVIMVCMMCTSCNAQNVPTDIPTMEYNDASGEEFDTTGMLITPCYVVDFIYHTQDNEYVIEYYDPDMFDMDYEDSSYPYIEIYCDSTIFYEYLSYYGTLNRDMEAFWLASNKYFIEERYLSTGDKYLELVKY